jgi:cohesin complex subunit SA-1/2
VSLAIQSVFDWTKVLYSKNHLDVTLTDANVETPASSKTWEPLRAYDKRLITAMAKDKGMSIRAYPPHIPAINF